MGVSPTCRVCREEAETIGHIMSSCKPHMWSLYKERHDRVIYQLMKAFAKKLEVVVPGSIKWGVDGWHGVAALEGARAKIAVDLAVPTDRKLSNRRPDLILYLKDERRIVILEGAVAWEPLLAERERQKTDKHSKKSGISCEIHSPNYIWKSQNCILTDFYLGIFKIHNMNPSTLETSKILGSESFVEISPKNSCIVSMSQIFEICYMYHAGWKLQ